MKLTEFINNLKENKIILNEKQLELLSKYADFLLEYNKKINLTTITEIEDIYLKHFYDSLTISFYKDFNKISSLMDVGCGAGFPGIVLKIIYPNINLILVESNGKKALFLTELIKKLELKNINIINDRVENLPKSYLNSIDIVTCRALSNMNIISELCIPFVKVGGYFIAMKGKIEEELDNAKCTIEYLGAKIEKTEILYLPKEKSERNIIIINKIKKTKNEFPREYSKIIKKPLKKPL